MTDQNITQVKKSGTKDKIMKLARLSSIGEMKTLADIQCALAKSITI